MTRARADRLAGSTMRYGMELGIVEVLERHAASAADIRTCRPGIETAPRADAAPRGLGQRVCGAAGRRGIAAVKIRDRLATLGGAMQGMMAKLASDELIKNALQDYGTEHFEIACYTSLRTAASAIGDEETVRVAERILQDEVRMAEQLLKLIPSITNEMMVTQGEAVAAR